MWLRIFMSLMPVSMFNEANVIISPVSDQATPGPRGESGALGEVPRVLT